MFSFPGRFILLDTEYTSWDGSYERGWSGPNEYKEIIQIGAIVVDGKSLTEEGAFSVFIKPVKNPNLSDFIIELTGITQEKIDAEGISLPEALRRLCAGSPDICLRYGRDSHTRELRASRHSAPVCGRPDSKHASACFPCS